jgi:hypothetical protein
MNNAIFLEVEMKFKKLFLVFVAVFALSCQKDQKPDLASAGNSNSLPTGNVEYTVPEGWISETPSSNMRKAQFKLPGADGVADGELAVFFFPGTGGAIAANLSRWYNQFKQPDGSPTAAIAKSEKKIVNGLPITITFATGTFMKNAGMMMGGAHPAEELTDYALLAAIAETSNGPWFFKATGPAKTIEHWRSVFDEFVNSFKVSVQTA